MFSLLDKPELRDLVVILKGVDWHQLGTQLKVPHDQLKAIDNDYPDTPRKLNEMLQCWLNDESNPSWKKICEALQRIQGYTNIIQKIETEYMIAVN